MNISTCLNFFVENWLQDVVAFNILIGGSSPMKNEDGDRGSRIFGGTGAKSLTQWCKIKRKFSAFRCLKASSSSYKIAELTKGKFWAVFWRWRIRVALWGDARWIFLRIYRCFYTQSLLSQGNISILYGKGFISFLICNLFRGKVWLISVEFDFLGEQTLII